LLLFAGNYLQRVKPLQTSLMQEYIVRVEIFTFNNLSGGDFCAAAQIKGMRRLHRKQLL
jgi:hypothetical protein